MGNTESTTLFPGTSVTPGDSHPWRRPAFCRRSGHRNPSKFFLPTRISKARRATDSSLLRIQVTPEIGTSRICLKIDIVIIIVIVISKFLKRYLKAKRTTAPAYSRALRLIKGGFQRGVKKSSGPPGARSPSLLELATKASHSSLTFDASCWSNLRH